MDEVSAENVGRLRRKTKELGLEVHRLEAQVAHLEKELGTAPEDGPVGRRLGEVQLRLDRLRSELDQAQDELAAAERAREEDGEATEELERLVDSFGDVAAQVPELADLLGAMRLCVGALATTRRLARSHEALGEPKEIAAALAQALNLLARTLTTARGRALMGRSEP